MTDWWIDTFRDEFEKLLSSKTGWGRKEVMQQFDRALSNTVRRAIEAKAEKAEGVSSES